MGARVGRAQAVSGDPERGPTSQAARTPNGTGLAEPHASNRTTVGASPLHGRGGDPDAGCPWGTRRTAPPPYDSDEREIAGGDPPGTTQGRAPRAWRADPYAMGVRTGRPDMRAIGGRAKPRQALEPRGPPNVLPSTHTGMGGGATTVRLATPCWRRRSVGPSCGRRNTPAVMNVITITVKFMVLNANLEERDKSPGRTSKLEAC